jgi:outer membrane protein TolC
MSGTQMSITLRSVLVLWLLLATVGHGQSLTLVEAGKEALENHPITRIAKYTVEADSAVLEQRQSAYYPSISANLKQRYTERRGVEANRIPIPITGANQYDTNLSGSQILLDFGKRFHNSKEAEFDLEASRQQEISLRQDLLFNAGRAYFSVLRDAAFVRVQEHDLRLTTIRLEESKVADTAADQSQLQANLASVRVTLTRARNAEKRSRVALGTAMGRRTAIRNALLPIRMIEPLYRRGEAVELGLKRPSVMQSIFRAQADERSLKSAEAEYLPTLSLDADYNWSDRSYPLEQTRWGVGLTLSFPVLNEPFLGATVREAEADFNRTLAEAEDRELQATREVRESLIGVQDASTRARLGYLSSVRAIEGFIASWSAHRAGKTQSVRDVTNAQRDMISALNAEIQANFENQTAILELYRTTGTLDLAALETSDTNVNGKLVNTPDIDRWRKLISLPKASEEQESKGSDG